MPCASLARFARGAAGHAAGAGPGVAADQHRPAFVRPAFVRNVERQQRDLRAALVFRQAGARIGDVPAEMPDRALWLADRRRVDLVKQYQDVVGGLQRLVAVPFGAARAGKLPRIPADRGVGIDRVQMQMMEAWGCEHDSPPEHGPSRWPLQSMAPGAWPPWAWHCPRARRDNTLAAAWHAGRRRWRTNTSWSRAKTVSASSR